MSKSVIIGRFQTFHNGHAKLLHEANKFSTEIYIVIGSANAYPNIDNPFNAIKRINLINKYIYNNFSYTDRVKFHIVCVSDYRYNDERWKTEVRAAVKESETDSITMVGYDKDPDSYWLKEFGWKVHEVEPEVDAKGNPISATDYRNILFTTNPANMAEVVEQALDLPKETGNMYVNFSVSEEYARLKEEFDYYEKEKAKFKDYPYKGSMHFCTGDAVVVCNNHVLVIERKFAPGKGAWALPGGHKDENETFKACAIRELMEEVKIKVPEKVIRGSVKNSRLFDHPNRCAVFNKPTVAQYIVLDPDADGSLPKVKGDSDANRAFWVPMHIVRQNANRFFDDHYEIIAHFTGI
ncbi:putative bifunctional nicotinamide mononucleotide adenylyltransferase/ADP-ribose pyrophosphatase [Serratia phage 4S]|nr:putative bifunctional nicotinamide mononucleotide adenylyltransferase/ADP-ribose pyrophosphatase [Serratia phage 4S]